MRVPELITVLKQHASDISSYIGDFKNSSSAVLVKIGKAEETLKSLGKKVKGSQRDLVLATAAKASEYRSDPTKSKASVFHAELHRVLQATDSEMEDRKWESMNG